MTPIMAIGTSHTRTDAARSSGLAERGGREPAVPVHGGPLLGRLDQRSPQGRLRVVGEEREVVLHRRDIDHREGDREHREDAADGHDPNPRMLLSTWPTRKLYHTMTASSVVTMARVEALSFTAGCFQ